MWNNGKKQTQLLCKVCQTRFSSEERFAKIYILRCPHCNHALEHKKDRKHFIIHKCTNKKCPYYLKNLKKVSKEELEKDYGKNKYKLHYIYREFNINFFKIDLSSLPKNASSLKFSKFDKNGFHNIDGANYDLALRVTYYNFLRPHEHNRYRVLNEIDDLKYIDNMPGKWQMLKD